jgi:hypothetical protein
MKFEDLFCEACEQKRARTAKTANNVLIVIDNTYETRASVVYSVQRSS